MLLFCFFKTYFCNNTQRIAQSASMLTAAATLHSSRYSAFSGTANFVV